MPSRRFSNRGPVPTRSQREPLTFPFYWLVGLILSFAHERPLVFLTSFDRVNPRAFDVMVLVGIFFVLPFLSRREKLPRQFFTWAGLVWVYVFCAIVYAVFLLPVEYANFSLFYAAKYLQGLIAIYIALKIPLSERHRRLIMWAVALGGGYVGIYCIFEYLGGQAGSVIEIAPGKFVRYYRQVVLGPLGYSYFHIAQLSSLCAIVTVSLVEVVKGQVNRLSVLVMSAFIGWPLLVSGSRTGLGLLVISMVLGLLLLRGVKARFFGAAVVVGFVVTLLGMQLNLGFLEDSTTLSRISGSEGTHNSLANRLLLVFDFDLNSYKWGDILVLVGGGFYAVPRLDGLTEIYRVGYGIHNSYLFPLEQGGFAAATLFLIFLTSSILGLNRIAKRGQGARRAMAVALLAYLLASLPAYLAGQIFWMGFDTVHFNVYIVLLVLLALKPVNETLYRAAV